MLYCFVSLCAQRKSAIYATARWLCLSVSDRLSVTFVYCIETGKHILKLFLLPDSSTILVFRTKYYGKIPTESRLIGASNVCGL